MNLKEKVFQDHMEVELRNGEKRISFMNNVMNDYSSYNLDNYNEELKHSSTKSLDIMKVKNPFTNETVYERQEEVDWNEVAIDTKILVRDIDTHDWCNRYFAKYHDGKVYTWLNGATSWSTNGSTTPWRQAKLYKEIG